MAQTGALEVPPELVELFHKIVSPSDTRRTGSIRKHGYLQSRAKVLSLTNRSLLPRIRDIRDSLTPDQIQAWKTSAEAGRQNWWNLFVQDTAYRLKHGIEGIAKPSPLHQYKVGRIETAAPAERVLLTQYHPRKYFVNKKVRGNTTLREDVPVYENFQLPLKIETSYRSNLAPTRPDGKARFFAVVYSHYQGRKIETELAINFDFSTGWTRASATINEVIGQAIHYQLYIELDGVRGAFEWDNVVSMHTGTNWARDWRCTDVNNELTRVNWQIEKSWEELELPYKTAFESVYPEDEEPPLRLKGFGSYDLGDTYFGESTPR